MRVFHSRMDGTRRHYGKWSKPAAERHGPDTVCPIQTLRNVAIQGGEAMDKGAGFDQHTLSCTIRNQPRLRVSVMNLKSELRYIEITCPIKRQGNKQSVQYEDHTSIN